MRGALRRFARSDAANISAAGGLILAYVVTVFVSIILFNQLGPDATAICADSTNYTTEDCAGATDARNFFWTVLVVFGIAVLIAVLRSAGLGMGGTGGGGGKSRARRR